MEDINLQKLPVNFLEKDVIIDKNQGGYIIVQKEFDYLSQKV